MSIEPVANRLFVPNLGEIVKEGENMNKMNPEIKALWIAALRSGEYEQGVAALNSENKFCCLGVLCELAVKEGGIVQVSDRKGIVSYDGYSAYLPDSVREWAGVGDEDGKFEEKITYELPEYPGRMAVASTLTRLNDSARYNFNQIADVIEAQF